MSTSARLFPPSCFEQPEISIATLKETGLPLEETTYLAIGGGMGSFTWVDHLMIYGLDPASITAIGLESKPYARCRTFCRNSQILDNERLRSDSGGTPDNIWGWPGYATREMWHDLKRGQVMHAARLLWQIFSEPVGCEPFTPKAGQVYVAVDREARRIGWSKIWRFGWAEALRKTDDGRYVVVYAQTASPKPRRRLMVAQFVHLALGYPGPRLLPDLQRYRLQTGDCQHFVNAYEPHNHIYDRLRQTGGLVLLRGRGITSSRIIQRLYEERCHNRKITVLHLMRTARPKGPRYQYAQRPTKNHFDHQAYNFPKACFGGDLRFVMARADDRQRAELVDLLGGTTTARRDFWEDIIESGLREGWYQIRMGHLTCIEPAGNRLRLVIQTPTGRQEETLLEADYVIDATGLESAPERNRFLRDLLKMYRVGENGKGQIKVSDAFDIVSLRNETGRVYASGIMTLGGPFAPVDSFTGLQYAAQRSLDNLVDLGVPNARRLNPLRSVYQWLRWATGVQP